MAVEDISDQELAQELEKYGEKITLPLKAGRREILVKKLNHFIAREKAEHSPQKKKGARNRRTLDAVSSDDSDADSVSKSAVAVAPVSNLPSVRRRSAAVTPVVIDDGFKRPTPRRSRRSEPVIPLSSEKAFASSPGSSKTNARSSLNQSRDLDSFRSSSRPYNTSGSFNTSRHNKSLDTSESEAEESLYEVENKSINTTLPYDEEDDDEEEEEEEERTQPMYSNTRLSSSRLKSRPLSNTSQLFLNNIRKEFKYSPSFNNKHTTPSSSSRYTSFLNSYNSTPNSNEVYNKKAKKSSFYSEHVSEGLLLVVALFFLCLVFGYMFVKFDNSIFSWYGNVFSKGGVREEYLLCEPDEESKEPCYTKEEVNTAMIVIHDLYNELRTKAGEAECGADVKKHMTADDFKRQLKGMKHKGAPVKRLYEACADHIIRNPQWKLRALTTDGNDAETSSEISSFESMDSYKSLTCRIRQSFYRLVSSLLILLAVGFVIYAGYHYYVYKSQKSEVEQKQVFKMVEDIIDILKEKCDNDSDDDVGLSYMAVQHVRDQLLPPSKRRQLQPIWNKAVKFIEDNESRIRLETQTIRGEDFEVWRWIHTVPTDGKVWQGQAFGEHKEAGTSSIRYSPTPCLKVKNMFDAAVESDDDWYEKVQNAILEKTEGVADIVHMFVDEDSKEGCVYVKCSSREAAGKARQCLHGWWFDGRLITARYLRLEHYHKQFPDSIKAVRPLSLRKQQPRSSLRQPYFRSTLEMT